MQTNSTITNNDTNCDIEADNKYCIIIPIYNQPQHIKETIDLIIDLNIEAIENNIFIVDDGSNADCKSVLADIKRRYPNITLLENAVNAGKGAAVIKGILMAKQLGFSHALQIDADRQHEIADIAKFINLSKKHPQALICGQPIYDAKIPKIRLYSRYITHFWVWINTLSFAIKDSMCGFRVYPLNATAATIKKYNFNERMGFDIEIIVRLFWAKVAIINVPTKIIYHDDNSSTFRPFIDNLSISKTHCKLFFYMLENVAKIIINKIKNFFMTGTSSNNSTILDNATNYNLDLKSSANIWTKQQEKGSIYGMKILIFIFKILGSQACKFCLTPVLIYYYLFSKLARTSITKYVQRLKANNVKINSNFPVLQIFLNFGYAIVDRLSILTNRFDYSDLQKTIDESSIKILQNEQQGALILVSHLGNFDIARFASKSSNFNRKLNVIINTKNAKKIMAIMKNLDQKYDTEFISADNLNIGTSLKLKEKIENGEHVLIAADRVATDKTSSICEVNFFQDKIELPIGPYVLANFLNCPVLSLFCLKEKNNYHVYFHLIAEKINYRRTERDLICQQYAQKFANLLAIHANNSPLQWYNFYPFWNKE